MNNVKLPESFQNLSWETLEDLVDLFVYQNQRYIPKKQLYDWNKKNLVPTLFLDFVKSQGFEFQENSEDKKIKHPIATLLVSLVKKKKKKKKLIIK